MSYMSDNYNLRQFYLKHDQVPSHTTIRQTLPPALATIFFKTMPARQKELLGVDPIMKIDGCGWYVPPKDLLAGKAVKRPMKTEHLDKLSHQGIVNLGLKSVIAHRRKQEEEKNKFHNDFDDDWKNICRTVHGQQWALSTAEYTQKNTEYIKEAFKTFSTLYRASIDRIEILLHEEALNRIKKSQEKASLQKQSYYKTILESQSIMITDTYKEIFLKEKTKLKSDFIEKIEICRTEMAIKIHDLKLEKHVTIEKLRKFFECQNLACQVYVALKERERCLQQGEMSKYMHKKKVKILTADIALKDLKIRVAEQHVRKQQEINSQWQKRVCRVVKYFQIFVSYCLRMLPEYAEFFINMEKLMLLQLNEALEEPTAESIIVEEGEQFNTPVPKPHPFYLFCDKGYKPRIDQNLCPKHCTSSASQLPAIVINKRCIYAACDNFEQFTNKIKEYIHGKRGDDADCKDSIVSADHVPVKYTSSQQRLELKLQSSILQILQQEMSSMKEIPLQCNVCEQPNCFCTLQYSEKKILTKKNHPASSGTAGTATTINQFEHQREPNLKSFHEYIKPKKCSCPKTAKQHLEEHLPVYMRHMSKYESPDLPNYEMCSVDALKNLVKEARGIVTPISKIPSETKKDVGTQYSDHELEQLCTCFSDSEINRSLEDLFDQSKPVDQLRLVTGSIPTDMKSRTSSFAIDRAHSLRKLIDKSPSLKEIFKNKDC